MLVTKNNAGYTFMWEDGSNIIEIFRPGDPEWAPFEAVDASDMSRNLSALNKFANETPEYGRL